MSTTMYNAHPYFSLKNVDKKCTLDTAKYSISILFIYSDY